MKADARSDLDIVILGNHVLVSNARNQGLAITSELRSEFSEFWQAHTLNPFEGRNKILASVCPQVYGLYVVKLAVLLVLIGGVPHRTPNGTTIRGESHMLLVGDPGWSFRNRLEMIAVCSSSVHYRHREVAIFEVCGEVDCKISYYNRNWINICRVNSFSCKRWRGVDS